METVRLQGPRPTTNTEEKMFQFPREIGVLPGCVSLGVYRIMLSDGTIFDSRNAKFDENIYQTVQEFLKKNGMYA